MNIKQAKQIPITGILKRDGREPVYVRSNGDLRYFSPFRDERTPSFDVNPQGNYWHDFGMGEGGNAFDFAVRYFNLSEKQTLVKLEEYRGVGGVQSVHLPLFPESSSVPVGERRTHTPHSRESSVEIVTVRPIQRQALVQYLGERNIPLSLAKRYLQEVWYKLEHRERVSFGLAFENRAGGYEIRNKYDKFSTHPKDVSMVGQQLVNEEIVVFEGFMDMLSALAYYRKDRFHLPVMVVNGVGMKKKAHETLDILRVKKVHCYLDRDAGGEEIMTHLKTLEHISLVDHSEVYAGYKDFNAFLQAKQSRVDAYRK